MAHHTIEPAPTTVHGHYARDLSPVLTIDPGDTVSFTTLDGAWYDHRREKWSPLPPDDRRGHALCGPIAIRGARPGQTLVVEIGDIEVGGEVGWTYVNDWMRFVGTGETPNDIEGELILWHLDSAARTCSLPSGFTVPMKPFMGVLGLPADEPGIQSTLPPRYTGGNIDCKHLVSGSTLYLPIAVEGALFSTGDGHATQGDGEASGTAIECAISRCDLTFHLRDDIHINTPRAFTQVGWLTFGFHQNLEAAYEIALAAMINLLVELYDGLSRHDAIALASTVVDMHVTQAVNPTRGVHALLPHDIIQR